MVGYQDQAGRAERAGRAGQAGQAGQAARPGPAGRPAQPDGPREQASFWDGCHLRMGVSAGWNDDGAQTAEVVFADPDGSYPMLLDAVSGAERAGRIGISVAGDAQVLMLVEALEWSGRHLRELVERDRADRDRADRERAERRSQ